MTAALSPDERGVVRDSLGVGIGVGLYGVTFGALGPAAGLSVWQTSALSLLAFTGASQFAFLGVIGSGGSPLAGAITSVLLGGRNAFYGISLAHRLRVRGGRRLATAHLVIDESTAMAITRPTDRLARLGFYWTGLTIFLVWNLTTAAGAVAGTSIGDPEAIGLDGAVVAAFLGLLWPRLDSAGARLLGVTAAALALLLVPFTAPGLPIMLGGLSAVALAFVWGGGHDD
ncbi:MAG: AzlC family ABC transporter permease [Aeromicrobium sp.]|uniref:AzlC family ABC transporter permease n=1 Tax=Aeromicrobium sp. TaxID=1871063 RepID=UPI0039E289B4